VCAICGAEAVDRHHIIYRSRGGTDEDENLIDLCRSCHDTVHRLNVPPWTLFALKGNVLSCMACTFRRGKVCGLWGFDTDPEYGRQCVDFKLNSGDVDKIVRWPRLFFAMRRKVEGFFV